MNGLNLRVLVLVVDSTVSCTRGNLDVIRLSACSIEEVFGVFSEEAESKSGLDTSGVRRRFRCGQGLRLDLTGSYPPQTLDCHVVCVKYFQRTQ